MSSKRTRSPSPPPSQSLSPTASPSLSPPSSTTSLRQSKLRNTPDTEPAPEVMRCSLPPHKNTLSFSSYEEYEVHYYQTHVNRCVECGRNFPTGRFLDLHIEENHDPLVQERRGRGEKTYSCFIETCDRKCSTPQKRRLHLIDKHMFPRTYNFYIINDGIDKQTSMLRSSNAKSKLNSSSSTSSHRRRVSTSTPSSPQEGRLRYRRTSSFSISKPQAQQQSLSKRASGSESRPGADLDDRSSGAAAAAANVDANLGPDDGAIAQLEKSMSALRFVPASVTRNKGREKSGTSGI